MNHDDYAGRMRRREWWKRRAVEAALLLGTVAFYVWALSVAMQRPGW